MRRRASRACRPEPGSGIARRRSCASWSALRVWWDRRQLMPWASCTRRAPAWSLKRGRSWRGGLGNMPDSLLRAGTCNVRTLSGRMGAVMDMATEAGIHILCLQETKLTSEGIHALRQAFRHRGWRFLPGELHFDQQGRAAAWPLLRTGPWSWWTVPWLLPTLVASWRSRPTGRDNDQCWSSMATSLPMTLPSTRSCARRWSSGRRARARTTLSLLTGIANPSSSPYATCWRQGRSMRWTPTPTLTAWARTDSRMAPTPARPSTLASLPWALARTPALNVWALRTMTSWPMTSRSRALAVVGAGSRAACWMARKSLTGGPRGRRWRTTLPRSCRRATPRQHGDFCRARPRTPWPWTARPRGEPSRPVLTEGHAAKPPTVQTLRERKLRRAARRLAAVLQKERAGLMDVDYEKGKLAGYLRHIADAYLDLGDLLQYQGEEQLAYLQHAAEAEETRANQARLEGWKEKVKTDLPRLSRWVKASLAERPTPMADFAVDPDPQAKAEQAAKVWGQLWHRDGRPHGLRLRDLLARLHLPRAAAPEVQVSGEVLHRRAKASARKAAGSDDWSGRLWRGLPLEFFDSLAAIWNLVLKGASIPAAWLQVRICLIPKEEGGQRLWPLLHLLGGWALLRWCNSWRAGSRPSSLRTCMAAFPVAALKTSTSGSRTRCSSNGPAGPLRAARLTSRSASTPRTPSWPSCASAHWAPRSLCWTSLTGSTGSTLAGFRWMACFPDLLLRVRRLFCRAALSAPFA